jgi:lipopolysaccharide export system protein LptA
MKTATINPYHRLRYLLMAFAFFAGTGIVIAQEAPIHIEANSMTSTEKTNSVVFIGDVDARQNDVRIRSDKMTVYYSPKKEEGEDDGKPSSQQVEKIVSIGNVEVTRAEWLGTAKEMIYVADKRQVILSGNAKAWQEQNMVSGDRIIYYLDEQRSEVVGARTSATVGGSGGEEKKPSRVNMTIMQN